MQEVINLVLVAMEWMQVTKIFGLSILYWFLIFGVVSLICGFIKGRGSNGTKSK